MATKLDRLGRDAQDIGATIKALAARCIEVIVLQLGKLDLTSAADKLMLNMLAAVAEMERDLLVERTQSGLARAKAEGKTLGGPTSTTQEQRAAMARQHQASESISALARTFGISRASIVRIVKPTTTILSGERHEPYLQNPDPSCRSGRGWHLKLYENNQEAGGGVYPIRKEDSHVGMEW